MKDTCEGCVVYSGKSCSLKSKDDKCPCNECLVKVLCIEICEDLFDFIMDGTYEALEAIVNKGKQSNERDV